MLIEQRVLTSNVECGCLFKEIHECVKKRVPAPSYRWVSVINRMNRVFRDTCKIPLGNIVVINSYRRNSPRTSNTTTRQAAEIKLAANLKKEQRGTELILLETETLQNLISYKPSNNKIGERPLTINHKRSWLLAWIMGKQIMPVYFIEFIHLIIDFDRIFQDLVWCINDNWEKIFFSIEQTYFIQDTFIRNNTKVFYSAHSF